MSSSSAPEGPPVKRQREDSPPVPSPPTPQPAENAAAAPAPASGLAPIHPDFNAEGSDIALQSSRMQFKTRRFYLQAHSAVFEEILAENPALKMIEVEATREELAAFLPYLHRKPWPESIQVNDYVPLLRLATEYRISFLIEYLFKSLEDLHIKRGPAWVWAIAAIFKHRSLAVTAIKHFDIERVERDPRPGELLAPAPSNFPSLAQPAALSRPVKMRTHSPADINALVGPLVPWSSLSSLLMLNHKVQYFEYDFADVAEEFQL